MTLPIPLPPASKLHTHEGFSLAADAFFKLFPGRTHCDASDSDMVILFELMDKAAAVVHSQWLDAAPAAKAEDPTDTEILNYFEAKAREAMGEGGGWSHHFASTPSYIGTRNEIFPYATLRESAIAAIRGEDQPPAETPFSECVNPECPVGCPESHATPPSYWAMVDADSEPDEPVVQEVKPKRTECCGAYGEKSGPEEYFEPCKDCPHTQEVPCGRS